MKDDDDDDDDDDDETSYNIKITLNEQTKNLKPYINYKSIEKNKKNDDDDDDDQTSLKYLEYFFV